MSDPVPVVRYARRLSPGDVGSRVVVRRTLPEGGLGDVLGELVAWREDVLAVRVRGGALVEVPLATVVAGKPVPPAPRRRGPTGALELERVAALGWRPLESASLGGWTLRASEGFTGRGNSVLPLGEPGLPLDEALDTVREWYAARGLPALFQLPLPASQALDAALDRRGWTAFNHTLVKTAAARSVLDRPDGTDSAGSAGPGDLRVGVSERLDADWLAAYHYRGSELPAVAPRLLTSAAVQGFAAVRQGGRMLAIGRGALGEGWLGITGMEVVPGARRRGLGSRVVRELCAWALERGAGQVYLQVAEDNAPARALYETLGFAVHHAYHYRRQP